MLGWAAGSREKRRERTLAETFAVPSHNSDPMKRSLSRFPHDLAADPILASVNQ